MPNAITQGGFISHNIKCFLTFLGEGDEITLEKLQSTCNAYGFHYFRADYLKKNKDLITRMEQLADASKKNVYDLAKMFQEYQRIYSKEVIGHTELQAYYTKLSLLKKSKEEEEEAVVLKEKIQAIHATIAAETKKSINKTFNAIDPYDIDYAIECYVYIQSILTAQLPKEHLILRSSTGRLILQEDWDELYHFLTPDNKDEKKTAPSELLRFAFFFKPYELIDFIKDPLIIDNDNYVRIGALSHTIYLKKENNHFYLYDSNQTLLKESALAHEMALAIHQFLFVDFDITSPILPISFNIFGSPEHSLKKKTSPEILQHILAERKKEGTAVDLTLKVNGSHVLDYVCRKDNFPLVKALLASGQTFDLSKAIKYASLNGNQEMLSYLLAKNPAKLKDTPLHDAAKYSHLHFFPLIVKEHKEWLIAKNSEHYTPSDIASQEGQIEFLKKCVEYSVDLTQPNDECNGATSLHFAAGAGQIAVMKMLHVEHKMDFSMVDHNQSTPLHYAAINNRVNVLRFLRENKVDINKQNKQGYTALHLAFLHHHVKAAKELEWLGAAVDIVDHSGKKPFELVDFMPMKVLWDAILLRNQIINDLKSIQNEDAEQFQQTLIADYQKDHHCFLVKYALFKQDKITLKALQLFMKNAQNEQKEIKKMIAAAHKDSKGYNPAQIAVMTGRSDQLFFALESSEFKLWDEKDHDRNSLGHLAVLNDQIQIIYQLASLGAQFSSKNQAGYTAIELAAVTGKVAVLGVFAKLDFISDALFKNLAILAAQNEQNEIIEFLAKLNPDELLRINDLMHIAVSRKDIKLIKILVCNGFDMDQKDKKGHTYRSLVSSTLKSLLDAIDQKQLLLNKIDSLETKVHDKKMILSASQKKTFEDDIVFIKDQMTKDFLNDHTVFLTKYKAITTKLSSYYFLYYFKRDISMSLDDVAFLKETLNPPQLGKTFIV